MLHVARKGGVPMHHIKIEFMAASPMMRRRWDGKFYNAKLKPSRKKSRKHAFGYTKPHSQQS